MDYIGLEHSNGILRMIMLGLCLELVLAAFSKVPFEPLATCLLKHLTWKIVLLLAITSSRRASELHLL